MVPKGAFPILTAMEDANDRRCFIGDDHGKVRLSLERYDAQSRINIRAVQATLGRNIEVPDKVGDPIKELLTVQW